MIKPIGFLLCMVLFGACHEDELSLADLKKIYEAKQERGEDVTILYGENGYTKAKLFSKHFVQKNNMQPPYTEMTGGLRVDFYDTDTKITSTLTAKRGRFFESKGNVLVQDSVVIKNAKGETLHTEELIWNQSIEKFYTEKFVKVITPTQVIYGDGLEANQDFSEYEIKNVKGVIAVEEGQVPNLQ